MLVKQIFFGPLIASNTSSLRAALVDGEPNIPDVKAFYLDSQLFSQLPK